jgi:chaperone BCS1
LLKKIKYSETILVIEDIDATLDIVKSRDVEKEMDKEKDKKKEKEKEKDKDEENKNKEKTQLTLSGLLNAIDGVFSTHGRILVMTTNHPEVLDEALIRPGRIDCKYLFDNCDTEQIKDLFMANSQWLCKL